MEQIIHDFFDSKNHRKSLKSPNFRYSQIWCIFSLFDTQNFSGTFYIGSYVVSVANATVVNAATAIEVSDASTIAGLTEIDALFTVSITAAAISDTATIIANNAGGYVVDGVNIVATLGTIAEITAIDALNGTGTLTYTLSDTAANIIANVGGYANGVVNGTVTDSVSVSQVTVIDALLGTATYTTVTDTIANIGTTDFSAADVVVTDTTITGASADAIVTTGIITATITTDGIVSLEDDFNSLINANNAYTLTINDTTLTATEVADLVLLDTYTTVTIDEHLLQQSQIPQLI